MHVGYSAAKGGDATAAVHVVRDCIDPSRLWHLRQRFPTALIAAVHAQERSGRNALPRTYARAIAEIAAIEVDLEIVQADMVYHTSASAMARLVTPPQFDGAVQCGREYIVADDVVTSGSSLAGLRHYIEGLGGRVVLATALADAPPGPLGEATQLAQTQQTLIELTKRFDPDDLQLILEEYGIAPTIQHLTESQSRFILQAPSLDKLRDRISEAQRERD